MSERPLKRSAGTRGHRSAPLILAAGERLLDGEHSDPSERCPTSPRALPASASSQPQSLSPREQMLVQAMDRLAGIDIRRTFDLDGSGFVSAAVLRRSLSAFDPQVFNAHCLQLLLGPAQADSVRIQDVFGPFWQPFCHRVQLLEEKLAQTRRMSQKRQVELAQTAQDTADALRLAQRELAQLQPHNSCPSADTQDDARSILELRERLAHSEQQRKKMEEQLRKMSRAERQVPQKSLALKGAEEEGCKGRRKRGTPHWHEEAADSMDVQKLLSSEQTRKALEQDLRHALAKLDEAERDKQQLQRSLQALQASKPGSDAEGRANSARNDLLQHGADQELKRLELALAAQSEACRRQEQQLRELSAQKEELAAELKRQPDNSAEDLQAKLRKMEDEVIQVREVMATREREAVEAVHHAVCRTKAELEEPLRSSIEHLETKADAAFDRVTRAEAESQDLADCMRQISGELAKLHLDLDGSQQALAESNRRAGEATAAAAAAVAESDARLSKAQSQQKESENRLEFLSGEIIKLKLENATLQKNLAQQSAEISRLEQEGRGFQQEAARSSKRAEALRAELASQIAQLQTVQRESKDLARELELRSLPERRFEALDGEVQRLDGRLQQMTLQFLSSATSDDLSRVASRLAQTELQVPETHTTELHQLQKELGTVTGELGASRARLEAAVAEKQVLEARLAEALQDVEEARKQREEKGWEAAEAAASANREMARQRSESDEKYRLLEKEHSSLRDKLQSALSELAQAESQKKVLELQVETKCQQLTDLEERQERELAAQAEKLEQTQVEVDRLTTELSKASQGSPAEEFKSVAEELRPRSESENDGSEKDRKIQELQAQLDEVSQQLNQVQAELEQRSIEAAEALVDIGQDVDAIEWESGQRGRKLEAQIAEITEMEKDAEETVEALSEELDRCNAKLAASENKRRELEYHLEDTSAKLTSVQDELAQCQIDTAQALTAASDDLALLKAESEAEIRRLRALLEDSDGSDLLSPQHLLLPSQEGLSPKSGTGSVQSSAGNSVWT